MDSVEEILLQIKPYAGDSGTCNREKQLDYLNRARNLLWNKTDIATTTAWACINCVDGCYTLPSEYKQIRLAFLGSQPISLGNEWYQSVPGIGMGHGFENSCHRKMVQRGDHTVVFRDYTEAPYRIGLLAESQQDVGAEITVMAIDEYGTKKSETITLVANPSKALSIGSYRAVIAITKPRTHGRIRLYAVDQTNAQNLMLAIYQPYDINPTFRRYELGGSRGCQLTIFAKRKWYPMVEDYELVEFNSQALIFACMALVRQENRDPDGFATNLQLAVLEINRETADNEEPVGSPMRVFAPDNVHSLIPSCGGWGGVPFGY